MIRTIEDLQKAIADIPEDNIIYVKNWNGYLFDICCVDDATSVGFWELKLSDTCTAYPGLSQMQSKQYDPKYIERCNKKIWEILNDKKEWDDWTQISLSVQNAVQAAANVWEINTPEEKDRMNKFITELLIGGVLKNLSEFDIEFKKKDLQNE
jgi:hypothetical protein